MGTCASRKPAVYIGSKPSSASTPSSNVPERPSSITINSSKVPPPFISADQSKTVPFNSNPGGKVLMTALRKHNWGQIDYCMKHDIGKYYRDSKHGFTPLHQFLFQRTYTTAPSKEQYEAFIQYQLHAINTGDNRQATPLHFAIWYAEQENGYVTFDLLKYGADRDLKDEEGNTPMDYAENRAFRERKSSFIIENYDSDVSLDSLISRSTSVDEDELNKRISAKKKSAKLELMLELDEVEPTIV